MQFNVRALFAHASSLALVPLLVLAIAAALIGASLLSVLVFPAVALALRPWTPAAMPDRDPHVVNM